MPGSSARVVAQAVTSAGVKVPTVLLYAWFRASGQGRSIKAGIYEIKPGATPRSLLDQLVRGEQALRSLTLVEGWNVREVLAAVRASPDLNQDIDGLGMADIMARIGYAGRHPEGRFFPDTYRMVKHATASSVLRQAAQAMDQRLAQAWAQRAPSSPLRTPEEALILASIVEKETGRASDRPLIAGVFTNRLRLGMRLDDGSLDLAAYADLLGPKTRMVAVTHMSNVLGTINPVAEISRLAHAASLIEGADETLAALGEGDIAVCTILRHLDARVAALAGQQLPSGDGTGAQDHLLFLARSHRFGGQIGELAQLVISGEAQASASLLRNSAARLRLSVIW